MAARVVKAGRPSEEYLLRKLLCCERCGARMHGCRTGRNAMRRYQCSTRRHHGTCEQRTVPAQPLEEQLIDWLHDFQPNHALRQLVLDTIQTHTGTRPGEDAECRQALTSQLERLRDLYVMEDLTKPEYLMRRQALEEELQRAKPPTNPDLDRSEATKAGATGVGSGVGPRRGSRCCVSRRQMGVHSDGGLEPSLDEVTQNALGCPYAWSQLQDVARDSRG